MLNLPSLRSLDSTQLLIYLFCKTSNTFVTLCLLNRKQFSSCLLTLCMYPLLVIIMGKCNKWCQNSALEQTSEIFANKILSLPYRFLLPTKDVFERHFLPEQPLLLDVEITGGEVLEVGQSPRWQGGVYAGGHRERGAWGEKNITQYLDKFYFSVLSKLLLFRLNKKINRK